MAYVSANLKKIVHPGMDNSQGGAIWQYYSPTDSAATVQGAGYLSDALTQGMKIGDQVQIYDVTNTIWKIAQCLSFTGNAANLSTTAQTMIPAT